MSKKTHISFDPNAPGNHKNNIFGLPFTSDNAKIVLIPVPWDATVSYNSGTSKAPKAIFDASMQVDLYDIFAGDTWKIGIAMDDIPVDIVATNKKLCDKSKHIINYLANGNSIDDDKKIKKNLAQINEASDKLKKNIYDKSINILNKKKIAGIIGGEHSVPLGLIEALAFKYKKISILHIDAHADLRRAYEGFTYSHASIMYHVCQIPEVKKIIQLGVRDFCEEEINVIADNKQKIKTYFDKDIKQRLYEGKTWKTICEEIIRQLSENIYISFDVDGLDPKLCPNTGTPVPGGFDIEQIFYLFEKICNAKKKIIGFDVCEVCPGKNEWDANVGARIIYKLCGIVAKSNKLL